jgi:hypothetical protein
MTELDVPQHADVRAGHYYVSIREGQRYALLAGPFESHLDALHAEPDTRRIGCDLDPVAVWCAWGSSRLEPGPRIYVGALNKELGLPTDPAQLPIPARLLPPMAPPGLAWAWPAAQASTTA